MYLMIFDIFKQYFADLVNIWSIFGHVLGNWAQGLAWGGRFGLSRGLGPPGYYYGMQSTIIVDQCSIRIGVSSISFDECSIILHWRPVSSICVYFCRLVFDY